MNGRKLLLVAIGMLLSLGIVRMISAQEGAREKGTEAGKEAKASADPSGTWKWTREFNGQSQECVLKLDWDGKALTGEYEAFGNTSPIADGKLEGDQIAYHVEREFNGDKFDVKFNGKLADDEIVGKVVVGRDGEPMEFDWHAKRAVDVTDVLGAWKVRFQIPSGDWVDQEITLEKKADGLDGKCNGPFGEFALKDVKLDGSKLSFGVVPPFGGDDAEFTYVGTVRGRTWKGEHRYKFADQDGKVEFTGEKVVEKKSKAK